MPEITWPRDIPVDILATPPTWKGAISVDSQSWISTTGTNYTFVSNTALHVSYALSSPRRNSSSVQIGLVFMVVVILCNLLKVSSIYFTLRGGFARQILTVGDAVSSYLKRPDTSTVGACLFSRSKLIDAVSRGKGFQPKQWRRRRVHYLLGVTNNGWITYTIL
jgi:hypothetical protein